ncbi:hypothetical protein GCM10017752_60010 [Streptomyces roseoviridis]
MRPFDPEGRAERAQDRHHGLQVVGQRREQRRGGAETGQVDGDHVPLDGEDVEHGLPRLPVVAYPVEQQQRLTRAPSLVRQGDRAGSGQGLHGERDLCGHGCSLSS